MTPTFAFQVRGHPVTQGSKRAFVVKPKGGKARAVVTESGGQSHRDWRARVADAAQVAADGAALLDGPVFVHLHFRIAKPASAPKRRRTYPVGARSGDVDKLARCCLDSFTGVLYRDDSQVTRLDVTKDYGDPGVACYVSADVDLLAEEAS